jgi:hypothetical protein
MAETVHICSHFECLSSHVLELQSVLIDILLTSLTSQTRSTTTENMKKAKEAALS